MLSCERTFSRQNAAIRADKMNSVVANGNGTSKKKIEILWPRMDLDTLVVYYANKV